MQSMYYVGLDVHKKTISYSVKDVSGRIHLEGTIPATRIDLDRWMKILPQPRMAAMQGTVFTAWIYDHLKPQAAVVLKNQRSRNGFTASINSKQRSSWLRPTTLWGQTS